MTDTTNATNQTPDRADAETLPVRAVTLFSSGVAYTLREGEVDAGEARVSLTFRTTQVSDILKSLVLLDEAGTARAATYPSRDPVGRTLQSFAVDVTGNPSRADLLRQLRGATLEAKTISGETLTGRIVGIEAREEAIGDTGRTVTVETLTLLGDDGLAAVPLDKVRLLRLLDPRLDREFRDALTVLASGSDDNRRQVTLTFSGEERRTVRVGYVAEAPLWKVSYRLVLDDPVDESGGNVAAKPYLQGWAMVENTSDDDWNEVRLSLVSGRPVSFIQDLYQPLYVPRPVVPPDIIASPFPQTHGGNMLDDTDRLSEALAARHLSLADEPAAPYAEMAARPQARLLERGYSSETQYFMAKSADMRQSVAAQSSGQEAGELFQYNISTPVTLRRQQAAMIPIVAEDMDGEKLSLYNPALDARFPQNAIRLKNNTALHLKGGPITVFDSGVYAGDARMEDIPPGDSRLITYAVDLAVECERKWGERKENQVYLQIRRGVLTYTVRQRSESAYAMKNKGKKARLILVEQDYDPNWTLLEPEQPTERTARLYRFAVPVEPGKTGTLKVVTEKPHAQTVALLDGDYGIISFYASDKGTPPKIRAALESIVERRRLIYEKDDAAKQCERERDDITKEQERIRGNLGAIDRESALYRRYIDQLDKQETRLAELRTETERYHAEALSLHQDLRAYLDTLDLSGEG